MELLKVTQLGKIHLNTLLAGVFSQQFEKELAEVESYSTKK